MVRDLTLPEKMRAEAKALQDAAAALLKSASQLEGINRGITASGPKKSVNWRTADDIEKILKDGAVPEDGLLTRLAEENLVKGDTWEAKISNGRTAITLGIIQGYLIRENGNVRWVPGVRNKARVRKNI